MSEEKQFTPEQEFERQEAEYEKREIERQRNERWHKWLDQFSDLVNNLSQEDQAKGFQNAFSRQHRTLQQSMFRVMLRQIEYMASDEYRTDGRNEGSKAVAKTIVESFAKAKEDIMKDSKPSQWLNTI